jgi:hypothetical protein
VERLLPQFRPQKSLTFAIKSDVYQKCWQLMGPLEALNGMLLFGLTTAFMFAVIQKVWPLGSRERHQ